MSPEQEARDECADGKADPAVDHGSRRRHEPTPVARAIGLLSRREHSARELQRKLQARGLPEHEAAAAVGRVREAGWQDDARFAELLSRSRVAQGYGPRRIRAELATHGLACEVIADALADACEDWTMRARQLADRRHGSGRSGDRQVQRKVAEWLWRRGFTAAQVQAATDALADEVLD